MTVYVKKEDKNTMIPGIITTILFLSFSIFIFISSFKSGIYLTNSLLFAIIFFMFGVYFIYLLIKSPKSYKAKLVNEKIETYNGKQITYMEFSTQKEKRQKIDFVPSKYRCYTIGESNLIVGFEYSLKIKEFNWEPKRVEEIKDFYENTKNKITNEVPNTAIYPVFLSFWFILGGTLFGCILGMLMYPQYMHIYIIAGIFDGFGLFITVNVYKALSNHSKNNELNTSSELEDDKTFEE